jgi:hypothetical protein
MVTASDKLIFCGLSSVAADADRIILIPINAAENRLPIGFLAVRLQRIAFIPNPYLMGEKSFDNMVEAIHRGGG